MLPWRINFPFILCLAIDRPVTSFSVKLLALAALPGAFIAYSNLAQAQSAQGTTSLEIRQPEGAEELGRYLSRLASNPRDLDALIGAGEAALKLNDSRAAAGFFARAQEVSPSNYRVKTGLGRAMLGMENPVETLRLFGEAVRFGARDADIAVDRGLAFDLTGDQVRAQQDYKLALEKNGRDPVLVRRYAVSLGISGKWQEADRMLDPLLRKSDKGAWRDRAFILAMNGQAKQARDITSVMMPRNMAEAIQPFMDRMPSLSPAQRAAAVHFGNFPAGTVRTAGAGIPAGPKRQSPPVAVAKPQTPAMNANRDRRSRAESAREATAQPAPVQRGAPASPAARPTAIPPARAMAAGPLSPPEPRPLTSRPPVQQPERVGPPAQEPVPDPVPAVPPVEQQRRNLAQIMSSVAVPESERAQSVAPVDFSEIARLQAEKRKAQQLAAAKAKADAEIKVKAKVEAEAKAKAKAEADAKARNPARIWVQIATGQNIKALAFDMGKLRKKYPELLKGRDAWTSQWGATRRMVVGPFATTAAAKSFYSDWMKAGGDGYIWQSIEGLEVVKLDEK